MYSCSHVLCTHARVCNSHYLRQGVQCGLGRETVPGVEVQGGASDGGVHSEPPLLQDVVQGAEHGDLPANVTLFDVKLIMIIIIFGFAYEISPYCPPARPLVSGLQSSRDLSQSSNMWARGGHT